MSRSFLAILEFLEESEQIWPTWEGKISTASAIPSCMPRAMGSLFQRNSTHKGHLRSRVHAIRKRHGAFLDQQRTLENADSPPVQDALAGRIRGVPLGLTIATPMLDIETNGR